VLEGSEKVPVKMALFSAQLGPNRYKLKDGTVVEWA
jgi:hypothetical protein